MFFLLYKQTDDGVFDDFPKILLKNYVMLHSYEMQTSETEHFSFH